MEENITHVSQQMEQSMRFMQMFSTMSNKPIGTTMLVKVQNCPMWYVKMIKQENDIVSEHYKEDNHLEKKEYEAARLLGYRWYITKCVEKNDLGMATNKKDWFRLYDIVCEKINKSIETYHGIKCFKDGNFENTTRQNVVYIHVCDVITMMYQRVVNGENPNMNLPSSKLENIDDNFMDTLTINVLNNEEKEYLMDNFDIFYVCFGYWHNYSNLPIRMNVIEDEGTMEGFKIGEDEFFKTFQSVKLEELKRRYENHPGFVKDMFLLD